MSSPHNRVTIASGDEAKLYATSHYHYLLKCMLYVQSGDPDLRDYRAPRKPLTENPKKVRRWLREHENQSLFDMILVGYDFKKPRVYRDGEVDVIGHFRWQPYGEGREKVKLIWIEPHIRHYGDG